MTCLKGEGEKGTNKKSSTMYVKVNPNYAMS